MENNLNEFQNRHVCEKLTDLRQKAGLSMNQMARKLGYRGQSSIQRYEDPAYFKQDALPVEFVGKLLEVLVGKGTPAITRDEVIQLGGKYLQEFISYGSGEAKPNLNEINLPSEQDIIELMKQGLNQPGKSQKRLAIHLNLAQPQITRMLSGKRRFKLSEIPKIIEFFGDKFVLSQSNLHRNDRLKFARQKAGFKTALEAAEELGVKAPTYTHHENGTRDIGADEALMYSLAFGVDVSWLLFGHLNNSASQEPAGIGEIIELLDELRDEVRGLKERVAEFEASRNFALKDARRLAGMTQEELASAVGTTRMTIHRLENKGYISLKWAKKFSSVLGLNVNDFRLG